MNNIPPPYRRATPDDAVAMAELVNIAGDGLPVYVWGTLGEPGQSGWDVGQARARGGVGGFAFGNTVVREVDGQVAACLIGYPDKGSPIPVGQDIPAPLVPLAQLGSALTQTWYLNSIATYPEHRGKGFGTALLELAEVLARDSGNDSISLIVSDANATARRMYERHGYTARSTRAMVKGDWAHDGDNWILMIKDL